MRMEFGLLPRGGIGFSELGRCSGSVEETAKITNTYYKEAE
jgi:hypothetical protein